MRLLLIALSSLVILAGCGFATVRDLRTKGDGLISFEVSENYQVVYRRLYQYSNNCYGGQGAFVTAAQIYLDNHSGEIYLTAGGEYKVVIDLIEISTKRTSVKITYDSSVSDAWKSWAESMKEYSTKDRSDCPPMETFTYRPTKS